MLSSRMFFRDPSHQFRLARPSGLSCHGADLEPLTAVPNKLLRLSALVGRKVRPAFDKRSTINTSANSVHNSCGISTSDSRYLKLFRMNTCEEYQGRGYARVPYCSGRLQWGPLWN